MLDLACWPILAPDARLGTVLRMTTAVWALMPAIVNEPRPLDPSNEPPTGVGALLVLTGAP